MITQYNVRVIRAWESDVRNGQTLQLSKARADYLRKLGMVEIVADGQETVSDNPMPAPAKRGRPKKVAADGVY